MKRSLFLVFACAATLAVAQDETPVPEIPFDSVPNFLKLPPSMNLGEASGVAVNSKHHIFVFSRGNTTGPAYGAAAAQILEFGPDGTFIREIGKNLYAWSFAHAIRFDKDDNLWAIDKGSDMIVRFNPQGHVTMVFGRKKEASDEGSEPWKRVRPPRPAVDGQFRQPTDVTWDPAGDIFISDGYINSRVAKFDKNGRWVKQWGVPVPDEDRANPKPNELNTPHSIASDAKGNIYVADRGNRRIQVFDSDGNFERIIQINVPVPDDVQPWMGPKPSAEGAKRQSGAPWAICITPGPTQYLYSADAYPGRIYKLTLDGKVLGELGTSGRQLKEFGWIHELACPSENEIYAAEILNWRVQKLILHPAGTETQTTRKTSATPHKSSSAAAARN
ncbi:MAG TPA: peptidyl-alpha-hydroxyglycine alpha-amidating lyase family protein [Bryobacteraceae bacterium]|nr:peptidyl-alpha-hydroxyglycine alpha-amidating lyase family protein [Bryobacteraceae bacterium]